MWLKGGRAIKIVHSTGVKKKVTSYYPAFIGLKGRKCVVVGGGEVALRKVEILLEQGAAIRVISPDLCPSLWNLAANGEIDLIRRRYRIGDLQGAFLAFAATDDASVNQEMVKEAREKAVLVNVADQPENCDFIVPSYFRRGDVMVAISTGGKSPALARKIRTRLEKIFGHEYAALAIIISQVRLEMKQRGIKITGNAWEEALDLDLLIELLRKGENEKAKTSLIDRLISKQ